MKIFKHIPNSITLMNLLCGCFASIEAFEGDFLNAFYFMIAAALFDFCDGLSARLLGAYSPLGKELDSLADMVSFGVAPTLILFSFQRSVAEPLWKAAESEGESTLLLSCMLAVPFVLVALSALRLAKFNIDTRQTHNFIGLATPSAALMTAGFMGYASSRPALMQLLAENAIWVNVATVVVALLLVSNIPMFSFKFSSLKWRGNQSRFIFIALSLLLGLLLLLLESFAFPLWVACVLMLDIIINLVLAPFNRVSDGE